MSEHFLYELHLMSLLKSTVSLFYNSNIFHMLLL